MQHTELEHHLLKNLNYNQQAAVTHIDGPLLILAGAGSGKTTVITNRIAWLIDKEGIDPESILAMTFTNKAAEEMIERVQRLINVPVNRLWISTFHSFCTRILRQKGDMTPVGRNFVIFDPSDQKTLIRRIIAELKLNEKQFHPKKVLEIISGFKNKCLLPYEVRNNYNDPWTTTVLDIYDSYQQELKYNHACDFDDLLLHTERLLSDESIQAHYAEQFRYILVDEYQDTNKAQYLLVKHLASKHHNLCVVGDEDQSIYGWRGADINNILYFRRDFTDAVQIKLEQNYRSTQKILDAASTIIANNTQRIGKTLWTDLGTGNNLTFQLLNEGHLESKFVVQQIRKERHKRPDNHIAVLYRANWQSRQIEEALNGENIPYKLVGGTKFYERQEIKDILAYLRLIDNPFDLVSFRRSINIPTRGVGAVTMARIEAAIPDNGTALEAIDVMLKLGSFKGKLQNTLNQYLDIFNKASIKKQSLSLTELLRWLIVEIGYMQMLKEEATIEAESRLNNIEEFISAAIESESIGLGLTEFLDRITMASDSDKLEESAALSLMTIHCAKGLEFPTVFLIGMEEDVLPNRKAQETDNGIEEERRLFYVAITRAKSKLYLTAARRRRVNGKYVLCVPSRFLKELPESGMDTPINWNNCNYISDRTQYVNHHVKHMSDNTSILCELDRIHNFFEKSNNVTVKNVESSLINTSNISLDSTKIDIWPKGTIITSDHFGRGIITSTTGSGDNLTYTIRFSAGEKRIMAKFGMLKKVSYSS